MTNIIELIREHANIEKIKANLYDNRHNKDYVNIVDEYGRNALMLACENGNIEVVKLLLEANADIDIVDEYGNSALMYAKRYKHTEIIELLNKCNNYVIFNGKKYKLVEDK